MRDRKAFTLTEVLMVVLILAALATIAVPRIIGSAASTKINVCKTNVEPINRQIELYYVNEDAWPSQLTSVTENTNYFPDGPPECPFGKKYKMHKRGGNYRVREHHHR